MQRPAISLVITDLDNTVYDWLAAFVPAFYAMVEVAAPLIGVSKDVLLDELKAVHQRHGDSEHPFALLETQSVQRLLRADSINVAEYLDPAFHAFNRVRKQNLKLYDGVLEALRYWSDGSIPVVAYTDARVINCLFRLDHLHIRSFFSALYAPAHVSKELDAEISEGGFVRLLGASDRKPNPQTLLDICAQYSIAPSKALYVGDSLVRDVYMAKRAGLHSAWAKFGTLYDKDLWPPLVRVTHWTEADVAREDGLREQARGTEPEATLDRFDDLLRLYDFERSAIASSSSRRQ
ncbi:HAD family hydrolase [Bradyrhizobium ganzhouense]|uniref:HAD family hydrolase n=1 Tax=Bradyrhizobium ganzhouense TaxID=1179767 RepID=UPI003CE80BEE